MKLFSAIALILAAFLAVTASAQEKSTQDDNGFVVEALSHFIPGTVEGTVVMNGDTFSGTNGVCVKYQNVTLTADSVTLDTKSSEVDADGNVRIESGDQLWVGEHIHYNFKTRQMRTEQFRTGRTPVFAGGTSLAGNTSNHVYTAQNGYVTTDDSSDPAYQVRASRIKIIPGKSVEMWNAVMYAEGMPVFYFPYYKRNLGPHANNLRSGRVTAAVMAVICWALTGGISATWRTENSTWITGPNAASVSGPDVDVPARPVG